MTESLSAETRVRAALRRIGERDREVRAWTFVDAGPALATARALDGAAGPRGALHGLPVGVKDVIDVAGMATRHNSPLGDPRPALRDAPCVAVLRAAGAVILGKTDTTEFAAAGRDAATANPSDLERTPGGSSSGSAAAVADGHVPIALTTQTGGSTIRPASFCGIHALKPTWGLVPREGAKIYANSLDTIGFYARNLGDLDRLCEVFAFAPPAPRFPSAETPDALRIGICRTPYWDRAAPETVNAMAVAAERLTAAGCEVTDLTLGPVFDRLEGAFKTILFREGAVAFLDLARTSPELLHADFHERVASPGRFSDDQWRAAYDDVAQARREMEAMMAPLDAVLAPSAPGVAPKGRGPGDPIFNQMWTLLHLPCVNLPLLEGPGGLPLGLTLTAPRFHDRRLLRVAARVEAMMGARTAL